MNLRQLVERGDRPFATQPQVGRYFPAASVEDARRRLARSIERGDGPGVVIGAAGIGKSLLLQVLAAQYREQFDVVLLACAQLCTRRALLQAIHFELGLDYRRRDEGELRLSLLDTLLSGDEATQGLLLLVDEAQALAVHLLEELRLLTNLSRGGVPRVRLVMAGLPALEEKFASPELQSFSQRLAARCYLAPLTRAETAQYIRAQLAASHADADRLFAAACVRRDLHRDRRRAAAGESSLRSGARVGRRAATREDRRGRDPGRLGRFAAIADGLGTAASVGRLRRRIVAASSVVEFGSLSARRQNRPPSTVNDEREPQLDDRTDARSDCCRAETRPTPPIRRQPPLHRAAPRRSAARACSATACPRRSTRSPNRSRKKNWCSTALPRWRAFSARGRRASRMAASPAFSRLVQHALDASAGRRASTKLRDARSAHEFGVATATRRGRRFGWPSLPIRRRVDVADRRSRVAERLRARGNRPASRRFAAAVERRLGPTRFS